MTSKECGAAVGEKKCVLPEGHDGPHAIEQPAPAVECEHDWFYFHDGARCTRCGVTS